MTGEREERAREVVQAAWDSYPIPLPPIEFSPAEAAHITAAFSTQERDAAGEGCFSASYDQVSDVLYLAPNGPKPATCVDASISCLIRRSSETREFVGMTVIDWRAQCEAALATPSADNAVLVERLEAALKPFADVADEYHDSEDDHFEVWMDAGPQRNIRSTFELGKFRAARKALAALRSPSMGEG